MKAAWSYAWRTPAHLELAALHMHHGRLHKAMDHVEEALDTNRRCNRAMLMKAIILRRWNQASAAESVLKNLLQEDPLDAWATWEIGDRDGFLLQTRNDAQTVLDCALDYAHSGDWESAVSILQWHHENPGLEVAVPNPMERNPMTWYALAWSHANLGHAEAVERILEQVRTQPPDYFFPSRIEEQILLEWALAQSEDGLAAYGLGNFLYDRKRHEEAIQQWELARKINPGHATVSRNLGLAYWNVRRDGAAARQAYLHAMKASPQEARLVSEYSQLCEKLGDS
jgi:tetratricopeptide (TPR) repeat protein